MSQDVETLPKGFVIASGWVVWLAGFAAIFLVMALASSYLNSQQMRPSREAVLRRDRNSYDQPDLVPPDECAIGVSPQSPSPNSQY